MDSGQSRTDFKVNDNSGCHGNNLDNPYQFHKIKDSKRGPRPVAFLSSYLSVPVRRRRPRRCLNIQQHERLCFVIQTRLGRYHARNRVHREVTVGISVVDRVPHQTVSFIVSYHFFGLLYRERERRGGEKNQTNHVVNILHLYSTIQLEPLARNYELITNRCTVRHPDKNLSILMDAATLGTTNSSLLQHFEDQSDTLLRETSQSYVTHVVHYCNFATPNQDLQVNGDRSF